MAGVNKCFIIGNLGRDPEVTYTQSGTAVCKITVATSEEWKDKQSGEKKEKTEWHRITAFGAQAETIGRYMTKGSQIYVEGKLQTSQYEKDGITRYSTDIIVNNFQFIGNTPKNTGQQGHQQSQGFQKQPSQGGFNKMPQYQQTQENTSYQNSNNHQQPQQGPQDEIPFRHNEV